LYCAYCAYCALYCAYCAYCALPVSKPLHIHQVEGRGINVLFITINNELARTV
jgi:hypothetical protein